MITLFLLDVPENTDFLRVAEKSDAVTVHPVGPYFAVESAGPVYVDRRETGMRHAVWYSCIAGTVGCAITQWDKNGLRAEAQ